MQLEQFMLPHNYRVSTGDSEFIHMLDLTRLGIATPEACAFWRSLKPKRGVREWVEASGFSVSKWVLPTCLSETLREWVFSS